MGQLVQSSAPTLVALSVGAELQFPTDISFPKLEEFCVRGNAISQLAAVFNSSKNIRRIWLRAYDDADFEFDQAAMDRILSAQNPFLDLDILASISRMDDICNYLDRSIFKITPTGIKSLRIKMRLDC